MPSLINIPCPIRTVLCAVLGYVELDDFSDGGGHFRHAGDAAAYTVHEMWHSSFRPCEAEE